MKKLWEYRGWKLYAVLFALGFIEDFAYMLWLALATHGNLLAVGIFVYIWSTGHDLYYSIPSEVWQDKRTRRAEKFGAASGAVISLWLFPLR